MIDRSARKRPVKFTQVLFTLSLFLVSTLIFWTLSWNPRSERHIIFSPYELIGILAFSGSSLAIAYLILFGRKVRLLFLTVIFILGTAIPFSFCYWVEWRSQITKYDIAIFASLYLASPFFAFPLFPDRHPSKNASDIMHGAKIE